MNYVYLIMELSDNILVTDFSKLQKNIKYMVIKIA